MILPDCVESDAGAVWPWIPTGKHATVATKRQILAALITSGRERRVEVAPARSVATASLRLPVKYGLYHTGGLTPRASSEAYQSPDQQCHGGDSGEAKL